MVLVMPVHHTQVYRMVELLDVPTKTFLIDLVNYFLDNIDGKAINPFVSTIMEIPSHLLIEGTPIDKELDRMLAVIMDWIDRVDLSEINASLVSEHESMSKNRLKIKPTDAFLAQSYVVVEFEVSAYEADG